MVNKHTILVIEGAGAKMPLESAQIEYIETALNKPITDIIDLAVTTSAGSVIMGALGLGGISARELNEILLGDRFVSDKKADSLLKRIFKGHLYPKIPKYSRPEYINYFNNKFGEKVLMKDALIKLIMTSVDECENRTHFFKNWEEKDGNMPMVEACSKSFAAPYYFGGMVDKDVEAIWVDGGVGVFNLPLIQAYAQARKNGWLDTWHKTHILAIGGGSSDGCVNYHSYTKPSIFDSISKLKTNLGYYFNLEKGGAARSMSTQSQVDWMTYVASTYENLTFQFTNWNDMPKELDKMGNWKARWDYYDKGMELAKKIDLNALRGL